MVKTCKDHTCTKQSLPIGRSPKIGLDRRGLYVDFQQHCKMSVMSSYLEGGVACFTCGRLGGDDVYQDTGKR